MSEEEWLNQKGIEIRNNKVFFEGMEEDFDSIAKKTRVVRTPMFFTNAERIRGNIQNIRESFDACYDGEIQVNYALKANFLEGIGKIIQFCNIGVDCVSLNEAIYATEVLGFPKEKTIFTSPSVSNKQLADLLYKGIKININSESQLEKLIGLKKYGESVRPISIRLNPEIGAGQSADIITAGVRNEDGIPIKFGIEQSKIKDIAKYASKTIGVDTLHFHIGSGWLGDALIDFQGALRNALDVYKDLQEYGVKNLNIGGGPGIPYHPSQSSFPWDDYSIIINREVEKSGVNVEKLLLEPGRSIIGDTTVLLVSVNEVNEKNGIHHVSVDAGMGSLARPKLYHAYHHILNASNPNGKKLRYSIDGNVCETGDVFTQSKEDLERGCVRPISEIKEGDILAILDTGAYGYSMASNYCMIGRPESLIHYFGKFNRDREGIADLI